VNIYVASSWRNDLQPHVVEALRLDNHTVYDFKNPSPGDKGFHWSEIDPNWRNWVPNEFSAALDHPIAEGGFSKDQDALDACSACVLVLPCGKSAHLELGYAAGQRKLTVVYFPSDLALMSPALTEPELMYRMCDYICTSHGPGPPRAFA
jgi:hypothetical protein